MVSQPARLEKILASTSELTPYSMAAETMIRTDALMYGLGAAVLQKSEGKWKLVAHASRALMATEKCAQVEKKAVAIYSFCDKFYYHMVAKKITIKTNHRPLLKI